MDPNKIVYKGCILFPRFIFQRKKDGNVWSNPYTNTEEELSNNQEVIIPLDNILTFIQKSYPQAQYSNVQRLKALLMLTGRGVSECKKLLEVSNLWAPPFKHNGYEY